MSIDRFYWVASSFFALGVCALSPISPVLIPSVRAEGGCPDGFFPAGGGYCRNIVCPEYFGCLHHNDASAIETLQKYGRQCTSNMGMCIQWGDKMVPKISSDLRLPGDHLYAASNTKDLTPVASLDTVSYADFSGFNKPLFMTAVPLRRDCPLGFKKS